MDLVNSAKSLIKSEQVQIDNNVFKLHYKFTIVMLLTFYIILTTKQFFGDPIDCDVESRKDLIDTFCWILGTFTVKEHVNDYNLPGLGMSDTQSKLKLTSPFNRQDYYQWVCLVLVLQAACFYVPRYLWKTWEGERIKCLLEDLKNPLTATVWNSEKKGALVRFVIEGGSIHNIYTLRYCFCEVLNVINVILQIFLLNWFFSGHFASYALKEASYKHLNRLNTVFPKIAKCTYFRYGPSGTVELHDALCILPLNVLNEKIFLIIWYWLMLLLIISVCCVIYRGLFLSIPKFRVYLLRALTRKLDNSKANFLIRRLSFGDFYVLYRVGKNVNAILFKELIMEFHDHIISVGTFKNYSCNEV